MLASSSGKIEVPWCITSLPQLVWSNSIPLPSSIVFLASTQALLSSHPPPILHHLVYDVEIKPTPTKDHEEDTKELAKTIEENLPERASDIGVLIGAYKPNQEELSYKPTCFRNLTLQGICDNWNHVKPVYKLEVIEVTSWQTGLKTLSAIRPKMELHSPTHLQYGDPTTWRMFMDLSWTHQAQETTKHPKEAQVIIKLPQHVYLVMFQGNAKPNRFSSLQTYIWRPGETSQHPGDSSSTLPCTSTQRIRRILSYSHLPYLEPATNELSVFKKVPRQHLYMPKLSRYKGHCVFTISIR